MLFSTLKWHLLLTTTTFCWCCWKTIDRVVVVLKIFRKKGKHYDITNEIKNNKKLGDEEECKSSVLPKPLFTHEETCEQRIIGKIMTARQSIFETSWSRFIELLLCRLSPLSSSPSSQTPTQSLCSHGTSLSNDNWATGALCANGQSLICWPHLANCQTGQLNLASSLVIRGEKSYRSLYLAIANHHKSMRRHFRLSFIRQLCVQYQLE